MFSLRLVSNVCPQKMSEREKINEKLRNMLNLPLFDDTLVRPYTLTTLSPWTKTTRRPILSTHSINAWRQKFAVIEKRIISNIEWIDAFSACRDEYLFYLSNYIHSLVVLPLKEHRVKTHRQFQGTYSLCTLFWNSWFLCALFCRNIANNQLLITTISLTIKQTPNTLVFFSFFEKKAIVPAQKVALCTRTIVMGRGIPNRLCIGSFIYFS